MFLLVLFLFFLLQSFRLLYFIILFHHLLKWLTFLPLILYGVISFI